MKTARLFASLLITALLSASVDAEQDVRTITVSGQGSATSAPDMATINTGVTTQAATAAEALAANTKAMQAVLDELTSLGVADKDVQTSNFNVSPQYRQINRGGQRPEIVGYHVTNQVHVKVRNLPNLGGILDALVTAGSNQIHGISFGIDNPQGVLDQARNRAVADARSRAELFANAAGVKLGKVLSLNEAGTAMPRPMYHMAEARFAAADVPIATGEQELSASVTMVFEIAE
ncbi:MAG: SIMPL domain-containing protein [Pirellulaceae bacterium]